jgi:hypothetical protein
VDPDTTYFGASGEIQWIAATAMDASGKAVSGTSFSWSTSDPDVATVQKVSQTECEVVAVGDGSATITATAQGIGGTSTIVVERWVAWIEIAPEITTLASVGDTARFVATATDYMGISIPGNQPAWSSSDSSVATVTSTGLVTAIANGFAIIKASIYDSVFQWETAGEAWLTVGTVTWEPAGLTGVTVLPLAVDNTSGVLFAGTNGNGVYRSADLGDSWTQVNSGMGQSVVYSIAVNDDYVFIGADAERVSVYRSEDDGDTWIDVSPGTEASLRELGVLPNGDVLAATSWGLLRSTDNGDSWEQTGYTNDVDRIAVNNSGHIYIGTELNGTFRSTDNGATWVNVFAVDGVLAIGIGPITQNILISTFDGLFRSTDAGSTWETVAQDLDYIVLDFAYGSGGRILAATWEGGVYSSTDGGTTWRPLNGGLTVKTVWRLVVNATDQFFGSTENGVLRSTSALPSSSYRD